MEVIAERERDCLGHFSVEAREQEREKATIPLKFEWYKHAAMCVCKHERRRESQTTYITTQRYTIYKCRKNGAVAINIQ